jgi:type I restriction enzyme, S subunit
LFKTNLEIDDKFFLFYLQTEHFKNLVIKKGEGGVRIYLFYENFSEITIDVPFLEEQIKIANFLTSIDEKINHVQGQIQKMELWKKGLLQKMFV